MWGRRIMEKQRVVQFNEKHKWCGCFGFVKEEKPNRIMVGIHIPNEGIAYIFCSPEEVDTIGYTDLVLSMEVIDEN